MHNFVIRFVLSTYICCLFNIPSTWQAELRSKDARNSDLQENVKSQQAEAEKAKEELTQALVVMEKLKGSFNKDCPDCETKKSGLTDRAVNAEAALQPVVDELAGLKRQINAMTSAIFGKCLLTCVAQVNELYS